MFRILILFIITFYILTNTSFSQSRGNNPGEFYFSIPWYYLEDEQYDMIIFTDDHGQHFTQKYVYKHGSGEMPVGQVLADATPGVLYNVTSEGLYRSFNDGEDWEFVEPLESLWVNYATGGKEGELYKGEEAILYRSTDYGNSYSIQNDTIRGFPQTSNYIGELYTLRIQNSFELSCDIWFSDNYGHEFDIFSIPDSIIGFNISSNYPQFSVGSLENELYFLSWHYPSNYKIYRSINNGQSFCLTKTQTDTAYFWDENYHLLAGRGSGELYVLKTKSWIQGYYYRLHVFYSNDFGQTFSEFVHEFDENWTKVEELNNNTCLKVKAYPNPFQNQIIFYINDLKFNKSMKFRIIDFTGKTVFKSVILQNKIEWNANKNSAGIYYFQIFDNIQIYSSGKIIKS